MALLYILLPGQPFAVGQLVTSFVREDFHAAAITDAPRRPVASRVVLVAVVGYGVGHTFEAWYASLTGKRCRYQRQGHADKGGLEVILSHDITTMPITHPP